MNLKLMGWIQNDLSRLGEYCGAAAAGLRLGFPQNSSRFSAATLFVLRPASTLPR